MDKISLLNERKAALTSASSDIRSDIRTLVDEGSFVELAAFSFSKNNFYGSDIPGEGVVTGFATIDGSPYYLVAQDFSQLCGGLSKANCQKIARTLNAAEKNETPVVYLLHTQGVQLGEGADVLEGVSELLLKATQLKGTVAQYAIVNGEVYGSAAVLAAVCDCVFFTDRSVLCTNSPFVLSAKAGKNVAATEIGGYGALGGTGLATVKVNDLTEIPALIAKINGYINVPVVEAELNEPIPSFNESCSSDELMEIFEDSVELGGNTCPEVKTVLGRVGGIAVAAVIFGCNTALNSLNVKKIRNFTEFACCYGLPFVTFVDCVGIEASVGVNNSGVLKEITEYLSILDATDTAKIAVVTGKAVGLGYSLFAAKSVGFDYTYALCTAQISLFDAETAGGAPSEIDRAKFAELYADSDPVHAAKGGYLDNVIEPQFIKQYLIASLQMLIV